MLYKFIFPMIILLFSLNHSIYAFERSINILEDKPNINMHLVGGIDSNVSGPNPASINFGARKYFFNNQRFCSEARAKVSPPLKGFINTNESNELAIGGDAKVSYKLKKDACIFTNYEIKDPQTQNLGVGFEINF